MKNTKIISFASNKGGVGKTTTTSSVGSILAKMGFKVLMIDLDAQASLTVSFLKQQPEESIYEAMLGRIALPVVSVTNNLFLVPSSKMLGTIDIELAGAISREKILSDMLEDLPKTDYDFILIDCPPTLTLASLNGITASTYVIIPMTAEVLPFKGLKMISDFVNLIHSRLNNSVHILGILITRWENTNLSKTIEADMRTALGSKVFQTKIRKNVSVAEAPLERMNIVEYAPKSNGAIDYCTFTDELLLKLGISTS